MPGKAVRLVIKEILNVDGVLEVVDARCPNETRSSVIEGVAKKNGKPFWIVMNKTDLVPKEFAERAKKVLLESTDAVDVVFMSSKLFYGYNILRRSIKEYFGKDRKVRLVIVGFPNVGKSTLINALARKSKAPIAPKPGYTKGKQWIKVSSKIMVSDTPGVLPRELAAEEWRKILFPEDIEDACYSLLEKIKKAEGTNFQEIYGVEPEVSEEVLEEIGRKLNYIASGGRIDVKRVAQKILEDWNTGRLTAWWI